MTEEFDLSAPEGREQIAAHAAQNKKVMSKLITLLSGSSRSDRQHAASTVAIVATIDANRLVIHMADISDALNRPEAQTRWEVLNALCGIVKIGHAPSAETVAAAEEALYDEDSGIVREAAFRFFCTYGATSGVASKEVWPLIDEAIQCYHGNPEFTDMLTALVEFAEGEVDTDVSTALADRMRFDAENGRGTLRMRSGQIVEICSKRAAKSNRGK